MSGSTRLLWHLFLTLNLCIGAGVALGRTGTGQQSQDFFPFGVFDKSDPYSRFDKQPFKPGSEAWKAYRKKLLDIYKAYNINTVLNTQYRNELHARYVLDQLHESGIKVIFQPGHPFNRQTDETRPGYAKNSIYRHPAIIAYKLGNEPKSKEVLKGLKARYNLIRAHYDKPIVTAMVGEVMGESTLGHKMMVKGGGIDNAPAAWQLLDPQILFVRHYPFRRQYDLIHWYQDKMKMPFQDWAAEMEVIYKGRPWWYIPQLFGKGKQKSEGSYWRLPTAAEMNAMVHVALANGARGIIGWGIPSYDVTRKKKRVMMLDENLELVAARDGSYPMEQYGRIGSLVKKFGALLGRHVPSDVDIRGKNENVLKVPRLDPDTADLYVYVVNLDTESENRAEFSVPGVSGIKRVYDIYSGRELQFNADKTGITIKHDFKAGEAAFIRVE